MEIEVGKLYKLWNGYIGECLQVRDEGKCVQLENLCKQRTPGTFDNLSTLYGEAIEQLIIREATADDLMEAIWEQEQDINILFKKINEHDAIIGILSERMKELD